MLAFEDFSVIDTEDVCVVDWTGNESIGEV
jgi:hypothetical protein